MKGLGPVYCLAYSLLLRTVFFVQDMCKMFYHNIEITFEIPKSFFSYLTSMVQPLRLFHLNHVHLDLRQLIEIISVNLEINYV